jgi:hypothetical protein
MDLKEAIAAVKGKGETEVPETLEATPEVEVETEARAAETSTEETVEPPEPPPSPVNEISEWARLELKIRRERAELEAERNRLTKDAERNARLISLAKDDPRLFLQESGLDIEALTRQIVEGKKIDPVESRIEKLERMILEEREAKKQQEEAAKTQAETDRIRMAMESELASIRAWLEPQVNDYPYLYATADGDLNTIADAIQQIRMSTWKESGGKTLLTEAQIAAKLEQTWKTRFERVAPKITPPTSQEAPSTIGRKHSAATRPNKDSKKESGRDRAIARLKQIK